MDHGGGKPSNHEQQANERSEIAWYLAVEPEELRQPTPLEIKEFIDLVRRILQREEQESA